jgi:hypothetical protein
MLGFDPPLADAEDLAIPRCVASADEALEIIRAHHATWLGRAPGDALGTQPSCAGQQEHRA